MTRRDALDRVNGDEVSAFETVTRSPWIQLAVIAFGVGVAWSNLHAELAQTKLELRTEIAVMRTDLHTMRVLACRSYPHDSVCAP